MTTRMSIKSYNENADEFSVNFHISGSAGGVVDLITEQTIPALLVPILTGESDDPYNFVDQTFVID